MWQCSKCGTYNEEEFCRMCGEQKTVFSSQNQNVQNFNQQPGNQQGAFVYDDRGFVGTVVEKDLPGSGFPVVNPEKKSGKHTVMICVMLAIIAVLLCVIAVALIVPKFVDDTGGESLTEEVVADDSGDNVDGRGAEGVEGDDSGDGEANSIDISHIESIIDADGSGADVSVCIIDLKNGITYKTDNADIGMSASALVNIPILYTAYKDIDYSSDAHDGVPFSYRVAGRGDLREEHDGNVYTLSFLLETMLNYSDNNASNSIMDYYSKDYINRVCNNNGYKSVKLQRYIAEDSPRDNYISASDAAGMVCEMYNSDRIIGKDFLEDNFMIYDELSIKSMKDGLPSNVRFYNHNAVTSEIYNEVAIVLSRDAEYIIAFISNNGAKETSGVTASKISEYVYETYCE